MPLKKMIIKNWDIWKEEFDEICKIELDSGMNEDLARRLLIFTEGFMYKILGMKKEDFTPEINIILNKIREKNLLMMEKNDES